MVALTRSFRAWDGMALHVQEWGEGGNGQDVPLLCLPGLVRTADDFAEFAARRPNRRVVSLDYPGRGRSGRAARLSRYQPEACLRDVMDVCAALHLHRAVVVGTSFGGLLAMGLAAMRPQMLAGVILNDIGPEIGSAGGALLRRFIADDPALPDRDSAAEHLRRLLPYLSLSTPAQWNRFATLTYEPRADGRWHPRWDVRIAELLEAPMRNLWPLFAALPDTGLLLVRGLHSNILLEGTVQKMRALRRDMTVVEIDGVGHAPTLDEPAARAAIDQFLARL
jgi:pimeloyl-ACP methyl ester carboxylesterase